jgi:hypothetical protein
MIANGPDPFAKPNIRHETKIQIDLCSTSMRRLSLQ